MRWSSPPSTPTALAWCARRLVASDGQKEPSLRLDGPRPTEADIERRQRRALVGGKGLVPPRYFLSSRVLGLGSRLTEEGCLDHRARRTGIDPADPPVAVPAGAKCRPCVRGHHGEEKLEHTHHPRQPVGWDAFRQREHEALTSGGDCPGPSVPLGRDLETRRTRVGWVGASTDEPFPLELVEYAYTCRMGDAGRQLQFEELEPRMPAHREQRGGAVEGEPPCPLKEARLEPVVDCKREGSQQVGRPLLLRGNVEVFLAFHPTNEAHPHPFQ